MAALRGVNLGGWLIIEDWMTPSLFSGVSANDEYGFMQIKGARAKLRRHQHEFITEQDFAWMASKGVQIVRIPVGYWVLHGDAPYVSAIGRLDWAFKMCKKYKILVLLDIHGLPGSQNGKNHSGRVGKPAWANSKANVAKGFDITMELARRYVNSPVLWGVQIVNEPPVGLLQLRIRRYYRRAYRELVAILPPRVRIVYSDGFTPRLMSGALPTRAVMDIHWYHFVAWPFLRPFLYRFIISLHRHTLRGLKRWNGVIIGEWSGTYSQKVFDMYPVAHHATMVRDSIAWQLAAYDQADAWFYWTYKTDLPGVWNFRSLVDDGILPLK